MQETQEELRAFGSLPPGQGKQNPPPADTSPTGHGSQDVEFVALSGWVPTGQGEHRSPTAEADPVAQNTQPVPAVFGSCPAGQGVQ